MPVRFCIVFVLLVLVARASSWVQARRSVPQAGSAAGSPPMYPGVGTRPAPSEAPSSSRSPWRFPRRSRSRRCPPRRHPALLSREWRRSPPLPLPARRASTTTGTCAASSARPAPSAAPSSDHRRARRGPRFTAQQIEKKVMRLASQRDSMLARETHDFIKDIRMRPRPQPDDPTCEESWHKCLQDTREHMDRTREYLAQTLGTGDSEQEWNALERCAERLAYQPLRQHLRTRAMRALGSHSCIAQLAQLVSTHRHEGVPFSRMGAPPLSPEASDKGRQFLDHMDRARLPIDQLERLITATEAIALMAQEENGMPINSDNLVPLMSWLLVHADKVYTFVDIETLMRLIPPENATGKAGFYTTTLYIASCTVGSSPDSPTVPTRAADDAANNSGSNGDAQKAEPNVGSLKESQGYCLDPNPSPEPDVALEVDAADADGDPCSGDELFQSSLSLCSLSSKVGHQPVDGPWCLCRSHTDLSAHSSDASLPESECGDRDGKVAQLDGVGTLFSAVPVFLSRALGA